MIKKLFRKKPEEKKEKWIRSITIFFHEGEPRTYPTEEEGIVMNINCWIDESHKFLYIKYNHQVIGYNLEAILAYKTEYYYLEASHSYSSPGSEEIALHIHSLEKVTNGYVKHIETVLKPSKEEEGSD